MKTRKWYLWPTSRSLYQSVPRPSRQIRRWTDLVTNHDNSIADLGDDWKKKEEEENNLLAALDNVRTEKLEIDNAIKNHQKDQKDLQEDIAATEPSLQYLDELKNYQDHVLCAPSMSQEDFQDSYGVKGFTPAQLEQKIRQGRNHQESRSFAQDLVKSLKISGALYRKELIGKEPPVPDYPFSYISRTGLQDSVAYASQLLGLEEGEQQADLAKAAKRKNQRRRSRSPEPKKRGRDDDDEEEADGKKPRLTTTENIDPVPQEH